MSKITFSDFLIAIVDLVEAEGRALQDSTETFLRRQQMSLQEMLHRSGWMIAWIAAAIVMLLSSLGFVAWGIYSLLASHVSREAAPFLTGGFLLVVAMIFGFLARRFKSGGERPR